MAKPYMLSFSLKKISFTMPNSLLKNQKHIELLLCKIIMEPLGKSPGNLDRKIPFIDLEQEWFYRDRFSAFHGFLNYFHLPLLLLFSFFFFASSMGFWTVFFFFFFFSFSFLHHPCSSMTRTAKVMVADEIAWSSGFYNII